MSNVAWRAQPPDDASDEPVEGQEDDAEVVDLTRQRLRGGLTALFGGHTPPRDGR